MEVYKNNIRRYGSTLQDLLKELETLSLLRLVVFLFSAVIIVFLANERAFPLLVITALLCAAGFALLVKRYNGVDDRKRHMGFLKQINEKEVLRSENKLSDFPTGLAFIGRDHPYVSDLDVFGHHSLFQLLNRATTESGQELLAKWLAAPADKEVIHKRQAAVEELSSMLGWRQDFQAAGMHFSQTKTDYERLLSWAKKPVRLMQLRSKYLIGIIPLSILSTWALVYFFNEVLVLGNLLGAVPLIIMSLVNSLVLRRVKPVAEEITENLHENIKILGAYQALIIRIESETLNSAILQDLKSGLTGDDNSAAAEISNLKKIFEVFQLRGRKRELNHSFYSIFNVLWFIDIYLILATEKWKAKNGARLGTWSAAVSEFEVLASLAGFHYSNPSFSFPEIQEDQYKLHFEKLGHPLINSAQRVCNDFTLRGRGEIAMITGSNMAGKSTFLRSVGVNIVLALMGAPCCARSANVSHIKVFTSMRTQDNLEEGVSSFYAELKRIEQLLNLIKSGQPIFFILDEMFKGTNSKDRHRGGFSLIKQLKELNAFGMISTHDLDLADLSGRHMIVNNYSFNSMIEDGGMIFNYELTEGLCTDFNASELMKRSGIEVLPDIGEE